MLNPTEDEYKANMPSAAADYAYVPDAKTPSTWKLPIDTPIHIAGAITALTTGFRGNKVEIPAGDKGKVISRIRAAINKLSDKDQKANLLDRLSKVKELEVDKAFTGELDQTEVNYQPLSANIATKACASCRWFLKYGDCYIVKDYPEPILPTGLCDRWEATPAPEQPDIQPMPVTIVEPDMADDDSQEMSLPMTRRGFRALVMDTIKTLAQPKAKPNPDQAFSVFKGVDDKWYWMSRHTGKWVDREDEIIANRAHDEYVARVQKGLVPMPELWTWHKKGTMHGQADIVWKSGGFVRAIGHFTGTPEQVERSVKYYQKMGDKIKLSHMFKYPKNGKKNKVYYAYNTVEITTLPDGAEAFPYTTFEGLGNMPFTKQMEDQIRAIGGDEMWQRAQAAESKDLTDTKQLDDKNIASKNLDNFEGATIPEDDGVKALGIAQKDLDTRLKAVEALPALITSLEATIKGLSTQLATSQQAASDALAKANDNEKKLLEYQALKPPSSQSKDTLLSAREKALVEQLAEETKMDGQKSIIEQLIGNQPAVSIPS